MANVDVYRALNRLLTILERSLPFYLSYTSPWTRKGDEKATESLARIVQQQQDLAARAAEMILELGPIDLGEYPVEFYDLHDLSLEFLLRKLIEYQRKSIESLEKVVVKLQPERRAAALAEEALGMTRGHLETLEELNAELNRPAAPTLAT